MSFPILKDGSEQISYRNPAFPVFVAHGPLSNFPDMSALCHWHDDIEIIMPYEGYMTYNVNGVHIKINTGELLFVNSKQMHYGYSADKSDCRYICITCVPSLLCGGSNFEHSYINPIIINPGIPYFVANESTPGYDRMVTAVNEVFRLFSRESDGAEIGILSELYSFWYGLYTACGNTINSIASADPDIVTQRMMLDYIHSNYRKKLTLNDIASAGNVCRTRCCRIFKKFMQRTPVDYLNSYRLEKGIQLLRTTHMSMTEIAESCGFGSSSYFTELFTRAHGCPPTSFRRK